MVWRRQRAWGALGLRTLRPAACAVSALAAPSSWCTGVVLVVAGSPLPRHFVLFGGFVPNPPTFSVENPRALGGGGGGSLSSARRRAPPTSCWHRVGDSGERTVASGLPRQRGGGGWSSNAQRPPPPCVTFRLVVAPLRAPGRSPVLPFACCVGSLLSVGRYGRCSCWCRFRVRGAQ